jgi:hypothetical protein
MIEPIYVESVDLSSVDEDFCTDDMAETSDDDSSSSSSDDSSNSNLDSDGSDHSIEPKKDKDRGFVKSVEQKITEFFRGKPRPKKPSKSSRPHQRPQEPQPPEQDP